MVREVSIDLVAKASGKTNLNSTAQFIILLDLIDRPLFNSSMVRDFTKLIVCFCLLLSATLSKSNAGERLSDYLKLPPVMKKQIGNPLVLVKTGTTPSFRTKLSSAPSFVVQVPDASSNKEKIRSILAKGILQNFYRRNLGKSALSRNEKRMDVSEIVPMTREIFLDLGMKKLQGQRSSTPILNTWWKVRMGYPLQKSYRHQILVTNLHWERDPGKKTTLGHFCFALRKKGGDPQNDTMFDFRAPWPYDRRARFTEAFNIHNRLKLEGMTYNLYDWLHTQTEYRNCYVHLWIVPIHEEQAALLHDFEKRGVHLDAGNFRVGKKNCASLGAHFLDRLLPIGEEIERKQSLWDYPIETARYVVERFSGKSEFYKLTNVTKKLGREPTTKSKLRPAEPSRGECRAFRLLRNDPRMN